MILLLSICVQALADPYVSLDREIEDTILHQVFQLSTSSERWSTVEDFSATVFPSARVYYEVGLEYNKNGNIKEALRYCDAALQIQPNYVPALYDKAEILLLQGDAEQAKLSLLTLQSMEGHHWVVSYRLSQIAAGAEDIRTFEDQFKRALQAGMPLQILLDDRILWSKLMQSPSMSLSMEMMLSAMGEESTWNLLNRKGL